MCFCVLFVLYVFFFKQKTAYEMRISDWSSDVCSSDLVLLAQVFWLVDARSRQLLELTITALKEMEAEFPESYRLFAADALGQSRVISYTFAIDRKSVV